MSEHDSVDRLLTEHTGVSLVRAELLAAGAVRAANGILVLDSAAHTAAKAAAALGIPIGAIANSLVFLADDEPLLVLASGAHRVDLTLLAELTSTTTVRKADPESVRRHTGQAIGGVAPIGHPQRLTTLVDQTLAEHVVVWAAAGHPQTVFPTSFSELVALTNGTPAIVS